MSNVRLHHVVMLPRRLLRKAHEWKIGRRKWPLWKLTPLNSLDVGTHGHFRRGPRCRNVVFPPRSTRLMSSSSGWRERVSLSFRLPSNVTRSQLLARVTILEHTLACLTVPRGRERSPHRVRRGKTRYKRSPPRVSHFPPSPKGLSRRPSSSRGSR